MIIIQEVFDLCRFQVKLCEQLIIVAQQAHDSVIKQLLHFEMSVNTGDSLYLSIYILYIQCVRNKTERFE